MIGDVGIYIGVTATPARLDLNNTFDNNNEVWVDFPPHNEYTGQDIFFPLDHAPDQYHLEYLPDSYDGPRYLQLAVYRFLARVAFINIVSGRDDKFSMLVHTSGKTIDHRADMQSAIAEVSRVLVPGGKAIYVIGENTIKGTYIQNAKIITAVAERAGLRLTNHTRRTLPPNRRYLPPPSRGKTTAALDGRMRREVVLYFVKPKKKRQTQDAA